MGFKMHLYFNNTLGDKEVINNMTFNVPYLYFPLSSKSMHLSI